ncbi:MAG: serine/threonine protein phosphatase [Bacteroidales bacterium]|jgi:serine/threonine protein phosphatase 1|nr:serine/threonine protein phosphatase [Bacteroidales bacterium]
MSKWVVGDIHGCYLTLRRLLEDKIQLSKSDTVFLLGDIIDRGPRTKETLDYIIDLQQQGFVIHPIRGNHEERLIHLYYRKWQRFEFLRFLKTGKYYLWIQCGGKQTLDSFKVKTYRNIPYHYIQWLEALPYYHEVDDFIIVHAGLDFSSANPFSNIASMLTCKKMNIKPELINNKIIVHGHVSLSRMTIEQLFSKRDQSHCICLDNGCIHADKHGFGSLLALNLDTMEIESQNNID